MFINIPLCKVLNLKFERMAIRDKVLKYEHFSLIYLSSRIHFDLTDLTLNQLVNYAAENKMSCYCECVSLMISAA